MLLVFYMVPRILFATQGVDVCVFWGDMLL